MTGVMKDAEKSWVIPEKEWSEVEKKGLVAEIVRIWVIVMMKTHLFRWDGKIVLQKKGDTNRPPCNLMCCPYHNAPLGWKASGKAEEEQSEAG